MYYELSIKGISNTLTEIKSSWKNLGTCTHHKSKQYIIWYALRQLFSDNGAIFTILPYIEKSKFTKRQVATFGSQNISIKCVVFQTAHCLCAATDREGAGPCWFILYKDGKMSCHLSKKQQLFKISVSGLNDGHSSRAKKKVLHKQMKY